MRRRLMSGEFRQDAKLSTFFIGIARQYWYDQVRKKNHRSEKLQRFPLPVEQEPAPDQTLIDTERKAALQEAIALLGEVCQRVLGLWMLDLSSEEIAREAGFGNADVAKTKAWKCRQQLAEIIRQSTYFSKTLDIGSYGKKREER
jgi:RNA polymerase sigma factor (sigma-70 family)